MSRSLKNTAAVLPLALALLIPFSARAADDKDKDDDIGSESSVAEGKGPQPGANIKRGAPAPFPRIADEEETIYAVQRKAYLVNRRLEVTAMFAAGFTDRFVNALGPAGSVTYHIAENLGVKAFGVYMITDASSLTEELLGKLRLTPEVAKLTQMLWGAGLGFEWSPIYGKVEVLGAYLGNFSFYVDVGAGLGQTRVPCTRGFALDPNVFGEGAKCPTNDNPFVVVYEPSRLQMMAAFGGGAAFYFTNHLGLKLEFKDWLFPARVFRPGTNEPTQRFTDAIRNNIYIQVGATWIFGGED